MAIHNSTQILRYIFKRATGKDVRLKRRSDGSLMIRTRYVRNANEPYIIDPVMLKRRISFSSYRTSLRRSTSVSTPGAGSTGSFWVLGMAFFFMGIMVLAIVYLALDSAAGNLLI